MARHERRVWSLAYQISGNADDAREVTQEVFLKVHQHLDGYDPGRPFASWLYRITVNCSYDYIKRRPVHASLEAVPAGDRNPRLADAGAGPERRLASSELRAALRSLLPRLTPQERTVFVLRDLEGMPTREIAYILRCTAITVRRHSSNARLKLREGIAQRYPDLLPGGGEAGS